MVTEQLRRGSLFAGVFGRTVVVSIMGGALTGAIVWVVFLLKEGEPLLLTFTVLAAIVGAVFGVLLGALGGVLIGLVAAHWLVPYPGRRRCIALIRLVSVAVVALFDVVVLLRWIGQSEWEPLDVTVLFGSSLVGAVWLSPLVIRWYVAEMEPELARMSVDPTTPA